MQRVTIEVGHPKDLELLLLLVQKLGFKVVPAGETLTQKRRKCLEIIQKGSEVAAIDDPLEWQREQRKDRELPF